MYHSLRSQIVAAIHLFVHYSSLKPQKEMVYNRTNLSKGTGNNSVTQIFLYKYTFQYNRY